MQQNDATEIEIKRAAQLSVAEIAIGSFGHGFKIPLTGQILSLNQLGFLLNAVNRDRLKKSSVFEISGIAAALKSFSPAGQKIGPMLSIAMQGLLFWFGLTVFGVNIVGQAVGAVLLSLWSFVQPLITLAFIYGMDLEKLWDFYFKRMQDDYSFWAIAVGYALASVLALKLIVALVMTFASRALGLNVNLIKTQGTLKLMSADFSKSEKSPWQAALKDLTRPIFLISFILLIIFISQINGTLTEKIWMALRPLATAYVLFYILRNPRIHERLVRYAERSPMFAGFFYKGQRALNLLRAKDID